MDGSPPRAGGSLQQLVHGVELLEVRSTCSRRLYTRQMTLYVPFTAGIAKAWRHETVLDFLWEWEITKVNDSENLQPTIAAEVHLGL